MEGKVKCELCDTEACEDDLVSMDDIEICAKCDSDWQEEITKARDFVVNINAESLSMMEVNESIRDASIELESDEYDRTALLWAAFTLGRKYQQLNPQEEVE